MSEEADRRAAGWPRLLRDCQNLPVRLRHDISTGAAVLPAGLEGVVRTSQNGWHLLHFQAKPCPCCKVAARAARMSWRDMTPLT